MRFLDIHTAIGAAILLLAIPAQATHSHRVEALERRHSHHHHKKGAHTSPRVEGLGEPAQEVKRRGGDCPFPTNVGLVSVTPGSLNAGWAQAPDMPCKPGHYCPYACPPGQLMAQWDPQATSYTYPESQNGGLYCDSNGQISKPFPNKPYCYEGVGTVSVTNNCGKVHAVCQTVLPGYEDMLIPTEVDSTAVLAVPGMEYWASTASHFYHNNPGVPTGEGCVWGDGSQPIGNWAPYVSGANMDANGQTFVKIAWNPIYIASSFANTLPTWGLKITCSGGNCNGLPCSIDPAVNKVNEVTSPDSATGAGGGNFCVVTVPKGAMANIVVFNAGDSNSSGAKASSSSKPSPSPSPTPTHTPTPTPTPTTSSSSLKSTSGSSSSSSSSSTSSIVSTASIPSSSNAPHVLFENYTSTANSSSASMASGTTILSSASAVTTSPSAPATTKNAASNTLISSETMSFSALLALAVAYLL